MAVINFSIKGLMTSLKMTFFRNTRLFHRRCRFLTKHYKYLSFTSITHPYFEISGNQITNKLFSTEVTKGKTEQNRVQDASESPFQELMRFRKKQAECSVLVELVNKEEIPYLVSACQQFGTINNLYSYSGESKNVFLLVEFSNKDEVTKLLINCRNENISDAFTAFSRIVHYDRKSQQSKPETTLNVIEDIQSHKELNGQSVSDLIENIYRTEKLSELNTRLRFFFCGLLKDSLSGLFPQCDVYPFGSSVNGIGRHGCDLDLMLRLYPAEICQTSGFSFLNKTCIGNTRQLQKKSVNALADYFGTFLPGFSSVRKILHARVPIFKFKHTILGMECDVSINNMSAVLMSEMLYFCGEIDPRVRPLLYAVKKWAKEVNITYETPGSWITNFGLSLLVIFFLQNRPIPILPCLNDVIEIVGTEYTLDFKLEYLASISDLQIKATSNEESLAQLLLEFLTFLGKHPFKDKQLSVLSGLSIQKTIDCAICVEYPLEEGANVTKNISASELADMCEKARLSSKYLASNLQHKYLQSNDLAVILGVPNILKAYMLKSKKLDMGSLFYDEQNKHSRNRVDRRHAF